MNEDKFTAEKDLPITTGLCFAIRSISIDPQLTQNKNLTVRFEYDIQKAVLDLLPGKKSKLDPSPKEYLYRVNTWFNYYGKNGNLRKPYLVMEHRYVEPPSQLQTNDFDISVVNNLVRCLVFGIDWMDINLILSGEAKIGVNNEKIPSKILK